MNLPDDESMISITKGLERSFCDQTAYCLSENLEKPVVKRRPVSPK